MNLLHLNNLNKLVIDGILTKEQQSIFCNVFFLQ